MPQYTQEQLEVGLKKLPPSLRDALFSVEIADKLYKIGQKNGLTIEEIGLMAGETGNVITGLTRPEEFIKILGETLYVLEEDGVKKIASDINREVLLPLHDLLKSAHGFEINPAGEKVSNGASETPETKGVPPFMRGLSREPEAGEKKKMPELVIHPDPKAEQFAKIPAPVGFRDKTPPPEKISVVQPSRPASASANASPAPVVSKTILPAAAPVVPNTPKKPEPPLNLPVQPVPNSRPSLTIDLSSRKEKIAPALPQQPLRPSTPAPRQENRPAQSQQLIRQTAYPSKSEAQPIQQTPPRTPAPQPKPEAQLAQQAPQIKKPPASADPYREPTA